MPTFTERLILFSTEPEPLAVSVLAEHAAVSRASLRDALAKLESRRYVNRTRDDADRRVFNIRITPAGQDAVDAAVNDYLRAREDAARMIRPAEQRALFSAYFQLVRGLTRGNERRHEPSQG